MEFTKAHGTGNDFVVLLDLDDELDLDAAAVRGICDRHLGVGADGVIRIGSARDADVTMDYRNADGGVVEMCGNGTRVVALRLCEAGLLDGDRLRLATPSGVRTVEVERDRQGRFLRATTDLGAPSWDPATIPYTGPPGGVTLDDGTLVPLSAVSLGNPHAVIVVDDVEHAPVTTLGPVLEHHDAFPTGVNVEFVEVVDDHHLRLRVWERGVGETLSCGTGIAAAAVALSDRLGEGTIVVDVPGGRLSVTLGDTVALTGPAVEVARGHLHPDRLPQS